MKNAQQFINDVIIPLENKSVDTNKLYDLLGDLYFEGTPKLGVIGQEWPLPSDNAPGSYRYYDHQSQLPEILKRISLYTISGILMKHVDWGDRLGFLRGGRLYRAEYDGESRKLEATDLVYYGKNNPAPKYVTNICNCIPLGYSVTKARLINRVVSWDYYLLRNFGVDCAERAYQKCINRYGKRSIDFELLIKSMRERISDERLKVNETGKYAPDFSSQNLEKWSHIVELRHNLYISFNSFETNNAWKAIDAVVNDRFFEAAKIVREDIAFYMDEDFIRIKQEYKLPSGNDIEFDEVTNRLFYAYMKKELDWQVTHLSYLLGEE